jgi:hypothetical protein
VPSTSGHRPYGGLAALGIAGVGLPAGAPAWIIIALAMILFTVIIALVVYVTVRSQRA